MTSVHSRRVTDIRVNAHVRAKTAEEPPLMEYVRKAATPSHIVPRRRPQGSIRENITSTQAVQLSSGARANNTLSLLEEAVDQLSCIATYTCETLPRNTEGGSIFRCDICSSYWEKGKALSLCCENENCDIKVCRECLLTYIQGIVGNAPYSMPPIKCCGCRIAIPTHIWKHELAYPETSLKSYAAIHRDAMRELKEKEATSVRKGSSSSADSITLEKMFCEPDDRWETNTVDTTRMQYGDQACKLVTLDEASSAVVEVREVTVEEARNQNIKSTDLVLAYINGGKAMFGLRCASCDRTGSIYVGVNENMTQGREAAKCHIQRILSRVCGGRNDNRKLRLARCMLEYISGQITADSFINKLDTDIVSGRPDLVSIKQLSEAPHLHNGPNFRSIIACIINVERRVGARFALLRKHPFFKNRCCSQAMCFNCKVSFYHEGVTCAARLNRERAIGVNYCPNCAVPTVRSEGCDHIVCPCGFSWSWGTGGRAVA